MNPDPSTECCEQCGFLNCLCDEPMDVIESFRDDRNTTGYSPCAWILPYGDFGNSLDGTRPAFELALTPQAPAGQFSEFLGGLRSLGYQIVPAKPTEEWDTPFDAWMGCACKGTGVAHAGEGFVDFCVCEKGRKMAGHE